MRVPANIHDSAHAAGVVDHHGCIVFYRVVMNSIREMAGGPQRLAEEEIQHIDAVRGDIEERAASGLRGIEEPAAIAARSSSLRHSWHVSSASTGLPMAPASSSCFARCTLG